MKLVASRIQNQKGQGLVEYALLVLLIVGIVTAAVTPLRNAISTAFSKTTSTVNAQS